MGNAAQILAALEKAWVDGFQIIAAGLNESLAFHGLSIQAPPPQAGMTLEKAQRRFWGLFSDFARLVRIDHPEIDEVIPEDTPLWALGYPNGMDDVNGEKNRIWLTGQYGHHPEMVAAINTLAMRNKSLDDSPWKKRSEWKKCIVEPVNEHAAKWRKQFAIWHDDIPNAPNGTPGRPPRNLDIARFANGQRKKKRRPTWEDIAVSWRANHSNESRPVNGEYVRQQWRNHFGDKASAEN